MDVAIVKVENLSHRYSSQWAIQDISFEINQTGVLGLLGSNGAGKSTTMNIMCGVLKQTKGEVYINGVSLRDNPVEANIALICVPWNPSISKLPWRRRRINVELCISASVWCVIFPEDTSSVWE